MFFFSPPYAPPVPRVYVHTISTFLCHIWVRRVDRWPKKEFRIWALLNVIFTFRAQIKLMWNKQTPCSQALFKPKVQFPIALLEVGVDAGGSYFVFLLRKIWTYRKMARKVQWTSVHPASKFSSCHHLITFALMLSASLNITTATTSSSIVDLKVSDRQHDHFTSKYIRVYFLRTRTFLFITTLQLSNTGNLTRIQFLTSISILMSI